MIDWSGSMDQTFEYYTVDPITWKDRTLIRTIRACTITRDNDTPTLGSATIDVDESLGECYVRVYIVVTQNGFREKRPLGTFLVQTPTSTFDGKTRSHSIDAYTPLIELKETMPPIGYSILKGANIMEYANRLVRENARAPVIAAKCSKNLFYDFVSDTSDTWLTFLIDLVSNAKYSIDMDEMGRIMFAPHQETASLQPVWTYTDDNSSILSPEVTIDRDLYGIPNVIEVIYSSGGIYRYAKVVNDDPNSPTSTVNRGREIAYRETDPDLIGDPTNNQIQEYAERRLKELSSLECTVTYTHGFCPTRVGDCVRLNYTRAGLNNVKARIISQTIKCRLGCQVTEKAVFTTKLWR
jgi:hypothetical protein